MAFSKDVERLARSLAAQKLEPLYIKHYLMETYAMDGPSIDALMERVGIKPQPPAGRAGAADAKAGKKQPGAQAEAKPPGQGFY